jgi:hypothetical protein
MRSGANARGSLGLRLNWTASRPRPSHNARMLSRLIVMGRALVVICVAALVAGSSSASDAGAANRCLIVAAPVVRAIQSGLTVGGGGRLVGARAVKSRDYRSVYFISAVIRGSGMGRHTVGTWATNRLRLGGLIYAVDSFANEFSDWGDGRKISAHLSMADDRASASRKCIR